MDNSKEYLLDLVPEPLVLLTDRYEVIWANKTATDLSMEALKSKEKKEESNKHREKKRRGKNKEIVVKAQTCYELLYLSREPCLNCPVGSLNREERHMTAGATTVDILGRPIFVEASVTYVTDGGILDGENESRQYLCLCRNITSSVKEKIKLEAQLSVIARARAGTEQSKLSQLITNVNDEPDKDEAVDISSIAWEGAVKSRNNMMLKAAKDLRAQMNGVLGMTQLLKVCKLEENVAEYVELLGRSCENLNRVIDNIDESARTNDYASVPALPGRLRNFKLSQLMRDIGLNYSVKAEKKNLELMIHSDSNIPDNLVGDYDNLYRAISFAVENAMICGVSGRIELKFSMGECRDINFDLIIGIVIGKSNFDNITDSYCDFSIIEKRCKEADGRLEFEKNGFKMHFPLKISLVRMATSSYISEGDSKVIISDKSDIAKGKARVLVADRDVNTRIAIKSILKNDYELYFAKSGIEAIELYIETNPDVFIVDILLPEIDGFDILDELNNRGIKKGSVIAMTEMIVKTEPEYLAQYGFDDYLSKPVKPSILRQIVDMGLNGYGSTNKGKRKK